jgi:hypothetical protein
MHLHRLWEKNYKTDEISIKKRQEHRQIKTAEGNRRISAFTCRLFGNAASNADYIVWHRKKLLY